MGGSDGPKTQQYTYQIINGLGKISTGTIAFPFYSSHDMEKHVQSI